MKKKPGISIKLKGVTMAQFVSPSRKMQVWGEKMVGDKPVGELLASFEPYGRFITEDEELIEKLKNHGAYGVGKGKFTMVNTVPKPKGNVIQGIRSAATAPILDKEEKLIRLGTLRAKLLRNDGSFRKDASDEDKEELRTIEQELGV
jgi:hypothetical protein